MDLALIKDRLTKLGVQPNKKLGQNFLINPLIIERIIEAVRATGAQALVEVGPGLGALTESLLKLPQPLTLIELDRTFAQYWVERDCKILREDALQLDWTSLTLPLSTCLVSNLPYQISSSIVIERSLGPEAISSMVLMFQKEVAQRIASTPRTKEYGLLSVFAQSFWQIQKVCDAGPGAFFPPPQIASRVLKFTRRSSPIQDRQGYLAFVKAGFAMRRKQVGKALIHYAHQRFKIGESEFKEILKTFEVEPSQRAEEIKVEQWQNIFLKMKTLSL